MPARRKINKDDIVNASVEIIREEGMESLNARRIAKELGCSTQPIFYIYSGMEDIKKDALRKIAKIFDEAMLKSNYDKPAYKDIGRNYIKFAKEEPIFFKLLFNSKINEGEIEFIQLTGSSEKIFETISNQTGMPKDKVQFFHLKMWLYVNGIANLVSNKTCDFSDDEIDNLLKEQYISMILLEIHNGILKRGHSRKCGKILGKILLIS